MFPSKTKQNENELELDLLRQVDPRMKLIFKSDCPAEMPTKYLNSYLNI